MEEMEAVSRDRADSGLDSTSTQDESEDEVDGEEAWVSSGYVDCGRLGLLLGIVMERLPTKVRRRRARGWQVNDRRRRLDEGI
jgi:hypothetical protein